MVAVGVQPHALGCWGGQWGWCLLRRRVKRCPLGMSGLRCFVVGSGKGLPVALSTPVPWHHPAVGETEAWRGWTGSAGVGLHSQGCCILQESWRRAEGEPLATTPSLLTFGGVARQEGSLGSCSVLAEPAPAFWLSLQHKDGNANRNGEALGEKMSTALGRVPGLPPPRPARRPAGHHQAGSPLPRTAGGFPPLLPGLPALSTCLRSRAGTGLPQGWPGRAGFYPSPHRAPEEEEEEGRWEEGERDTGHTLGLGQASGDWRGSMCRRTARAFPAFWLCFLIGGWAGKSSHAPDIGIAGYPRSIDWAPRPVRSRGGPSCAKGCQADKGPKKGLTPPSLPPPPPPRARGRRWRHAG